MKNLTGEQIDYLERKYNVYIDAKSGQYNIGGGYGAETGWMPIPDEWTTASGELDCRRRGEFDCYDGDLEFTCPYCDQVLYITGEHKYSDTIKDYFCPECGGQFNIKY